MGLKDYLKKKWGNIDAKKVLGKSTGQKESYTRPDDRNNGDERSEHITVISENRKGRQSAIKKAIERAAAKRKADRNK